MRADRLLSILLLLQVNKRLTARELATRLEVSERTIHRDMEALGASGVPVVAERGTGGGWALLEEYRTNLTGLNEAEVRALFLAQPTHLLAALGVRDASEAAQIKLLAALPGGAQHDAAYARRCIHVDGVGWHGTAELVPLLPVIHDAIWQEHKLHMRYQRSDGSEVERVVDPLGLVVKGSVWYMMAAVDGEVRSYRVSRLRAAEIVPEPLERPANFDLAAAWEQSTVSLKRNLPRYPVTLRCDPAVLPRLRQFRYAQVEQVGPIEDDGWLTVQVLFEIARDAFEHALMLGEQLEIIAPAELRILLANAAEAIATRYVLVSH